MSLMDFVRYTYMPNRSGLIGFIFLKNQFLALSETNLTKFFSEDFLLKLKIVYFNIILCRKYLSTRALHFLYKSKHQVNFIA